MSIQLKYNGFIINKIDYEYKSDLEKQQEDYYLEFMLDDISVAVSEEDTIITLSGHANCSNEEDKDASNYRTLKLNVDYFYDIEKQEKIDNQQKIQETVKNYGINNSIIMFQELIKQITSLDSAGPISSYDFRFPGSLK